jgi:hypothetical protein
MYVTLYVPPCLTLDRLRFVPCPGPCPVHASEKLSEKATSECRASFSSSQRSNECQNFDNGSVCW